MRRAILACLLTAFGAAKRSAKDWSKLDLEKIDKEWADGDEAEELTTERDEYERMLERRKQEAGNVNLDMLQSMTPEQMKSKFAHQQSSTGMAMIFITLSLLNPETGDEWTKDAEEQLATKFTSLLHSGGLKVSVYRIDPRRLLVTMQTGWYGEEVKDFMITQPAVMKVTWDSVDYVNPDVEQVDPPSLDASKKTEQSKKKAKPSGKKKQKKAKDADPQTEAADL